MSIVIENHGGFTSDAVWLVDLMKSINHPNLGTLPDFGTQNFCIEKASPKEGRIFSSIVLSNTTNTKGLRKCFRMPKG